MRTASALAVLALALGVMHVRPAQARDEDPTIRRGPLAAKIDEAIQRATAGRLWGAVLVAREGEILLAKGYGYADYATRPNTPNTLFEIASASKPFTALALLRLEQEGKLSTAATLGEFFEGLEDDKRGITVHQLLTHTSGLSPRIGVPYAWTGSRAEYVTKILAAPLASEPGEKFAYANAGYALLASVVEEATGRSFEEVVRDELFQPAGLEDTGFIKDARLVRSDRVSARLGDNTPPAWTAANWFWGWGYRGMGGVVTTVLDLHRWDRALRGDRLLTAEMREKLYTPAKAGYACGWRVETTSRGTTKVHHSGGVMGYAAQVSRWLEEDVLVVVLTNPKGELGTVVRTIERHLFPPARVEADIDVEAYELTRYRAAPFDEGLAIEVRGDEDALVLEVRHEERVVATIRLPASYAAKLVGELERALSAHRDADDEALPAMDGGIYLSTYGGTAKRLHLEEGLEIRVLPRYRGVDEAGHPVVDPRPVFVLDDTKHRQWPVMVKMNVPAARALLDAVRRASR